MVLLDPSYSTPPTITRIDKSSVICGSKDSHRRIPRIQIYCIDLQRIQFADSQFCESRVSRIHWIRNIASTESMDSRIKQNQSSQDLHLSESNGIWICFFDTEICKSSANQKNLESRGFASNKIKILMDPQIECESNANNNQAITKLAFLIKKMAQPVLLFFFDFRTPSIKNVFFHFICILLFLQLYCLLFACNFSLFF